MTTSSPAQLLDGKALSARILDELQERVARHVGAGGTAPGLATVLVGDDPASHIYVRNKRRACEKVGLVNVHHELAEDVGQERLLGLIGELNRDPGVHGIQVQLTLPRTRCSRRSRRTRTPTASTP
jgi:methylenetetrahydrofolate dehydrogenase (NADP+)/methenyltetrahydrofolate cyclohydrolase